HLGREPSIVYFIKIVSQLGSNQRRIQDFGPGGSNFRNSGQSRQYFVTLQYTLHEMIEINMKTGICESRSLGTFSLISLEVNLVIKSFILTSIECMFLAGHRRARPL